MSDTQSEFNSLRKLLFVRQGHREIKAAIRRMEESQTLRPDPPPSPETLAALRHQIIPWMYRNNEQLQAAVEIYLAFAPEKESQKLLADMATQLVKRDKTAAKVILSRAEPLMPKSSRDFMNMLHSRIGKPPIPKPAAEKARPVPPPHSNGAARNGLGLPLPEPDPIEQAEKYLHEGNVRKAMRILTHAIEKAPNNIPLLVLLGSTYLEQGDPNMAQSVCDRIAAIPGETENPQMRRLKRDIDKELNDPGGYGTWRDRRQTELGKTFSRGNGIV